MQDLLLMTVLVSIGLLIASMVIAGLEARISDFMGQGCLTTVHCMNEAEQEMGKATAWLRDRTEAAFTAMGEEGIWVGWRILGAWLYLAVSVVSCIGDLGLLLLTFSAMGLTSGEAPRLGIGVEVLSALAYLGSAVIFGLLLLDCFGRTHFGPWPHEGGSLQRKFLLAVAMLGLATSALIGGLMGWWRGLQVIGSDWGNDVALLLVSSAIPFLLVVAVALGLWALAWAAASVWTAALHLGVLGLSGLRAPLRIGARTCEVGFGFLASGVALVATPGRTVYTWLYSFEGLRTRLHLPPIAPPSRIQPTGEGSPPDNTLPPVDVPAPSRPGGNGTREVEPGSDFPDGEFVPSGIGRAGEGVHRNDGYPDDGANWNPFERWRN